MPWPLKRPSMWANQIEGKGNVVMFVFDAFPPVQIRGVIADAVFGNYPDITVMDRITPRCAGRRHRRQPGKNGSSLGSEP